MADQYDDIIDRLKLGTPPKPPTIATPTPTTPGTSVPPDDDYGTTIDRQRTRQEAAVAGSLRAAEKTTPDARAESIRLANQYRMPVEMVERNLEYYRQQAVRDSPTYDNLLGRAPKLSEWLARDPQKAAAAVDDVRLLAEQERTVTFGASILRGVDTYLQGSVSRTIEWAGDLVNSDTLRAYGRGVAERNEQEARDLGYKTTFADARRDITSFGQWFKESVGEQLPVMGTMVAGGAAGATVGSAFPVIGTTIGGVVGALFPGLVFGIGETQANLKQIDPDAEAPVAVFLGGSAIAALDAVTPGRVGGKLVSTFGRHTAEEIAKRALLQPVKPKFLRNVTREGIGGFASEGLLEAIQESVGAFAAAQGSDTQINLSQLWDQMVEAAATGALVGGTTNVSTTMLTHQTEVARYAASQQGKLFFDALADGATNSALLKRLPDAYQEVLHEMTKDGPVADVFVDVKTFEEYFQSKGISPEAMASELTGRDDALSQARETNAPIAIPTAAYAAKLAATDHHGFFAQELRLSADAPNAREGKALEAQVAAQALEIQATVEAAANGSETPEAKLSPLRQAIVAQALADPAFHGMTTEAQADPVEVANIYAAGIEKVITNLATLAGEDPEALLDSYNLSIGSEGTKNTFRAALALVKSRDQGLSTQAGETPQETAQRLAEGAARGVVLYQAAARKLAAPPPKVPEAVAQNLLPEERAKLRAGVAQRIVEQFRALPGEKDYMAAALAGKAKRGWYAKSASAIETVFGGDSVRFAALLAALSPRTSVEANLINAVSTWKTWVDEGRPQGRDAIVDILRRSVQGSKTDKSVLRSWVNNAITALTTEDPSTVRLSGPKVNPFMLNLLGHMQQVTTDAWMTVFAGTSHAVFGKGISRAGHQAFAAKIRRVAQQLSEISGETWTPAEVQETVWSWTKTLYELSTSEGMTAEQVLKAGLLTDAAIADTPDFARLFTQDAPVRAILEAAGYGDILTVLEADIDPAAPADAGAGATGAEGAGAPGEAAAITPSLLRSARRLDWVRAAREAIALNPYEGLVKQITEAGGFTYTVIPGVQPTTGLMLSIFPERSQSVPLEALTPAVLARYVKANADLLLKPGNHFGAWNSNGTIILDVSRIVGSPAEAQQLGQKSEQVAYYDLATGQTVDIVYPKEWVHGETWQGAGGPGSVGTSGQAPAADAAGGDAVDRGDLAALSDADGEGTDGGGTSGSGSDSLGTDFTIGPDDDVVLYQETARDIAPERAEAAEAEGQGRAGVPPPAKAPRRPSSPNAEAQALADAYAEQVNRIIKAYDYVEVDMVRAVEIADLYDLLPVDDSANPDVARAYRALAQETQDQWDFLIANGITLEPWTKPGQPYANSNEMAQDVRQHRRLYFFTGGEDHPFLGQATRDGNGLTANDKFRAIHDYFGHAAGGYGFGPRGEENAWRVHSQMFSGDARRAMTTETRGQNSWVNFGRQNWNEDGTYRDVPPADRPYATQKVALLPDAVVFQTGAVTLYQEDLPATPTVGTWATSRLTRAVEIAKQNKASGRDWKHIIKGSKLGVNADEFALAHVFDLDDATSYTKDEVLAYLRLNGAQIEWVSMGTEGPSPETIADRAEKLFEERVQETLAELEKRGRGFEPNYDARPTVEHVPADPDDPESTDTWTVGDETFDDEEAAEDEAGRLEQLYNDLDEQEYINNVRHSIRYDEVEALAEEQLQEEMTESGKMARFTEYQLDRGDGIVPDSYREVILHAPSLRHYSDRPGFAGLSPEENEEIQSLRRDSSLWADLLSDQKTPEERLASMKGALEGRLRGIGHQTDERMRTVLQRDIALLQKLVDGGARAAVFQRATWRDGHEQYDTVENPIVRLRFNVRETTVVTKPAEELNQALMQEAIKANIAMSTFATDQGMKAGEAMSDAQFAEWERLKAAVAAGKAEMLAKKEQHGPGGRVLFLEEIQPPRKRGGHFDAMPPLFQKNWRELAFKWALRYAAEQGLTGVAWTTGAQQAERYSLAREVQTISWGPADAGDVAQWNTPDLRVVAINLVNRAGGIRVMVNRAGMVVGGDEFAGESLASVIGDQAAARILDAPSGTVRPDQLSIGGEGLSRLYDVDFVTVAQKLPAVKKAGVKVGSITINRAMNRGSDQHFVPLTPELKDAVLGGQTLFHEEQSPETSVKRGKIAISDAGIRIELLEHANLSTFLHETGHLYLHVMSDLVEKIRTGDPATWTDGQKQLIADHDRIYAFLGVTSRNQIGREQHETFARAFEAYLMKGKAPVKELRSAFGRYRTWLTKIYRSIANLQVVLNPEITEVFDRLVASQDAIAEADKEARQIPVFSTAAQAGMTDIAWQGYQAVLRRAHEQREDELAREILEELKRERKAWWKSKRAEVRAAVVTQLEGERVYQALGFLKGDTRLSKDAIVEKFGKDRLATLPLPYVYAVDGGLDPDAAAELLGFSSGDALLTALAGSEKLDVVADRETDARMQAEFGDMRSDGTLRERARQVVQEAGYEDVVAAELKALAKAVRAARPIVAATVAQVEAEEASARRAARAAMAASSVTTAQVNATAQAQVAKIAPKDLHPRRYWLNARTEGQASAQAVADGRYEQAVLHKQRQRLSLALYKAAQAATDEVEAIQRYAQRMSQPPAQARLGKAGESYQAQVNALLNKFEFANIANAALDRRATLSAWVADREAEGLPVNVPADVLEAMQRVNFRMVPMERLREMRDTVKTIAHLAKLKGDLLTAKDQRTYDAARDKLVAHIRAHNETVPTPVEFRRKDVRRLSIANMFASHKRIATIAAKLDGFIDGGPMTTLVIRPLNDAADAEATRRRTSGLAYNAIIKKHYPGRQLGRLNAMLEIPAIGMSLSKEATIAVALNWGNDANRQRLLTDPKRQWTAHQVEAILDTLDERDWSFVQETWDFVDSFWPEISDKQFRVTGLRPEKVEATAVSTKYGTFRGGYYPLQYDGRLSRRAETTSAISEAKLQLAGAYISTTTKRGHTQARVEHLDRPLKLELGVVFQHLDQVIHDLTHHEALIDVSRILRDQKVADAIYDTVGGAGYKQFTDALADIAVGLKPPKNMLDDAASFAKTGTQIAALGLNFWTTLQQPLGLFNGAARVGPTWVARGMYRWLSDAATAENTMAWIREVSPFMANRSTTQNQDIMDLRGRLSEPGGWFDRMVRQVSSERATQQTVTDAFLWQISLAQRVADVPTWLGQYEKSKAAGKADADAVAEADQAVKDSQGGGQTVDLASIQRLGPTARLFMVFYSYGNTVYNQTARAVGKTEFSSPVSLARFLGDLSLIYFFPALGTVVLSKLFRGDDEDDDLYDVGADVLTEMGASALNSMVLLREAGGMLRSVDRGYQGPAGTRVLQQLYSVMQQVNQGEVDEGLWKALNSTGGILFKYPAGQVQRTVEGFAALAEGQTSNPLALVFGPPRE